MNIELDPEYYFWEADFRLVFPDSQSHKIPSYFGPFETEEDLRLWRGNFLYALESRVIRFGKVDVDVLNQGNALYALAHLEELKDYRYIAVGCSEPNDDARRFFGEAIGQCMKKFTKAIS